MVGSLAGLVVLVVAPPDVIPPLLRGELPTPARPSATASGLPTVGREPTATAPVSLAASGPATPTAAPTPSARVSTVLSRSAVSDAWFRDPWAAVSPAPAAAPTTQATPESAPRQITGLRVPSIGIDTDVVQADLVGTSDGSFTWDVPKFVAGHAEGTAGAGEVGNAVLFGHVTSLTLGNVFEHLHDAHPGDEVQVLSDTTVFTYRVLEVRTVPRTDTSIVDPTPTPTLTLVTCTGLWNPALHDYMQRLVVRAELVGAAVDPPVQPYGGSRRNGKYPAKPSRTAST